MSKERITLNDTMTDVVWKLSEGNPGAMRVIMDIVRHQNEIDPYCQWLLVLLWLDTSEIYGPRIWKLFNDVCKQRLDHTLVCLRATQLGLIPHSVLNHAIDNHPESIDMVDLCTKVKGELPNFKIKE